MPEEMAHHARQTVHRHLLRLASQLQKGLTHPINETSQRLTLHMTEMWHLVYTTFRPTNTFCPIINKLIDECLNETLTVWSDTLILVSWYPAAFASAMTRLVFPTPGLPSKRIGLVNWSPLNTRDTFKLVVGAKNVKLPAMVEMVPNWNKDKYVSLPATSNLS